MPMPHPPAPPVARSQRESVPGAAAPRRGRRRAAAELLGELDEARAALDRRGEALAASLAMTRAVLESTPDGILATDDAGCVTACNEAFLQIWGFTRAEAERAQHAELARRAAGRLRDPEGVRRRIDEIYARAEPDGLTDLIELADGREFERTVRAQTVGGRRVGRVWCYRDVTARRAAEAALRDEAGVLHFLNRTGATIAATLDLSTLQQTVIDAATQVSGAAFGAFLYRVDPSPAATAAAGVFAGMDARNAHIASAGTPRHGGIPMLALAGISQPPSDLRDPRLTAALFGAAWRGEQVVRCADVTALERYTRTAGYFGLADGDTPVRSFLAVPVRLRDGSTVGGLFFGHPDIGVFTERTERIVVGIAAHAGIALENARLVDGMLRVAREREQLVEAERAARAESARAAQIKDEFLSTLSHELRTPLTAILGWAKVLLMREGDEATRRRGLEAIERNANAQTALIDDLLDMSRIVSGNVRLDLQPTDVAQVVGEAIEAARPAADAAGLVLRERVDPGVGFVAGDPPRLRQVLANLLSNAIKFTPAQGRIEVSARRVGDQVELAVEDTGAGISPEFVAHVFDRFRQADASTTRRHGGLGLGLAIVRQLVSMHGGAVGATSGGPGQGARFVVRLPADVEPAPVPRPACDEPAAALDVDLSGLRLLVVDDSDDVRELVARLLEDCGADVRQAANAEAALREFRRAPPDLLLSDIGMPGRDGYELLREIRALAPENGRDVPAIALTAFARPEDRTQALLAGYAGHIGKPIQPERLCGAVAAFARRRTD